MKIAFVTYEYPPFVYGGAGVYAKNIVEKLNDRGHEVHVITFGRNREVARSGNTYVHHIGMPSLPFKLWIPSYWFSLFREIEVIGKAYGKFDVLVSNGFSALTLIKRKTRMPRILVMHQSGETVIRHVKPTFKERLSNLNNELGVPHIFDPLMIGRADKVVAVSKYVKGSIIDDIGIDADRIEVVYNGFNDFSIDLSDEEVTALKDKYGVNGNFSALFVGRASDRRKGLPQLLNSLAMVENKEKLKLLVVGNGINGEIIEHIRRLNLEKQVNLVGKVSDEELRRLYAICDVYVSNSYYESFGLTLVEAMSANKPVIARDVGGIGEVISDENGILIHDCTARSMTDAITEVMENPDKYKSIGSRNREYAMNKFSWERAAESMEAIALDLIEKRGR